MPDRKYLSKWFKEITSAADFADVVELKTSQEMSKKKVLLVLTGDEPDARAIKYALNVCKRVEAGLDILCITSDAGYGGVLEEHLKKLIPEGTEYHIAQRTKSIHDVVVHYLERSTSVQFVVIDSRDVDDGAVLEDRYVTQGWKGLSCPLVLVS